MTITPTYDELSDERKIALQAEGRKFSSGQIEQGVFLVNSGAVSSPEQAGAVLNALREYARMKREAAGEVEKRVPKVQQVINALQTLRADQRAAMRPDEAYFTGVEDSISVAGRYV